MLFLPEDIKQRSCLIKMRQLRCNNVSLFTTNRRPNDYKGHF